MVTTAIGDGDVVVARHGFAAPPPAVVSVLVNDGGAQRSMVTGLTVNFTRGVVLDAGAVALVRRGSGAVVTTTSTLASDGLSLTLAFPGGTPGSLADGIYDLTVVAARVHAGSPAGPAMAADHTFAFHRLFSDADGDGDSDNADAFQMRSTYNKASADPAYKWYLDYDGDGDVDNLDNFQVRSRRSIQFKGY